MKKHMLKMSAALLIGALATSCNKTTEGEVSNLSTTAGAITVSYEIPPGPELGASQEELAVFAWQEFFALNWQSIWSENQQRTVPNPGWNPDTAKTPPSLAVWETFIHRTELRPANGMRTRDLSTGKPHYTFIDSTKINLNGITLDDYWNILDEDNEIGSAYLFAHKNGSEVLYFAKSNLEEYNYVKKYFPSDKDLYSAGDNGAKKGVDYFGGLTLAQMCDTSRTTSENLICLPCADVDGSEGVIEIKLAFRKLDQSKGDDPSRFITKEVVVFKNSTTTPGNLDAYVETFGVIGMHIIRKTKNYPAFIFASWEQVDARNNNMQTIGLDTVTVDSVNYGDEDPHRLNPVIERVIPETIQGVNAMVQQQLAASYPGLKWQYYQLIGVQGTPTHYTDRTGDNNFFMANYVIESDLKLTNFHGSFGDPFNVDIKNVAYNENIFNMGGCQGCHGQAQTTFGTDFSFLLDSGAGKPVPTPDPYQTYEEALKTAQGGN